MNMWDNDPFAEHRRLMEEIFERDFKMSKEKDDPILGFTITVCDGVKHRTLSGGAYDHLVKIGPCDSSCGNWREAKGRDIADHVPNLSPRWFNSNEDVDYTEVLK